MIHPYTVGVCVGTALGVITAVWFTYWYHYQLYASNDKIYRLRLQKIRDDFQTRFEKYNDHIKQLESQSDADVKKIIALENRITDVIACLEAKKENHAIVLLENAILGNLAPVIFPDEKVLEVEATPTEPAQVIDGYLDSEDYV